MRAVALPCTIRRKLESGLGNIPHRYLRLFDSNRCLRQQAPGLDSTLPCNPQISYTHNISYLTYDSTTSGFHSPLCCGGIPGEASAVWDAELSCSAPACRACCTDLQTSTDTGHDANFGTQAASYHWWPCVDFVLHPTPAASQAGSSTSITTFEMSHHARATGTIS